MKYFRTKDREIFSLNEFKYEKKYHWYRPNKKYLSRLNIDFTCWHWCFDDEYDLIPEVLGKIMVEKIKREECKFADTIEELCDEFIIIDLNDKPVMKNEHERVKELLKVDIWHKKYKTIYGAIWTDKGLIYVAKMNDKGELELI